LDNSRLCAIKPCRRKRPATSHSLYCWVGNFLYDSQRLSHYLEFDILSANIRFVVLIVSFSFAVTVLVCFDGVFGF